MITRYIRLLLVLAMAMTVASCRSSKSKSSSDEAAPPDARDEAAPPSLSKRDLYGKWAAADERQGGELVRYSFTLSSGDNATFEESREGGFLSRGRGSWDLAGETLILSSRNAAMNGSGRVVGGRQVTINGRAYNKQ